MAKTKNSESNFSKKQIAEITKKAQELMDFFITAFELETENLYSIESYTDEENVEKSFLKIEIKGENLGVLIGYRGRNLRSLQRIFAMLVNRRLVETLEEGQFVRVVIDVAGYREIREESLHDLAERIRREVLASGEPVDLPAMNPYERRVIHLHLETFNDVTSESFGEGSSRYVTVLPVANTEKK